MKQASETIVRLLLLCVAVVIAACSNNDPVVTTGGVSGFVYDARSGEPLAGVALTVVGGVNLQAQAATASITSAA